MRAYSDNGRPYFYNIRTGDSRWQRPEPKGVAASSNAGARRRAAPPAAPSLDETSHSTAAKVALPQQPNPKPRPLDPNRALYSHLLTSLLWYRGSTGNGLDAGRSGAGWFYLDKVGQVHGPFESSMMRAWLRGGFFNNQLPVRYGLPALSKEEQERVLHQFLPIECYFPSDADAFPPVTRESMVKALQGLRQRLLAGRERPLGLQV